MTKTKEEILDEYEISANEFWSPEILLKAMEAYSQSLTKELQDRIWDHEREYERQADKIKQLEAKVNNLTMADMTHEYNEAEAEKFRPEYKRQIKEPLENEIERLKGLIEKAHHDGYMNVKWKDFKKDNGIEG